MKVGVIGCGNIADIYFKNSKQYFNNFEIVACADIKEEASKIFAEKYNVRQLSVEDILADNDIECIILSDGSQITVLDYLRWLKEKIFI